MSYDSQHFFLCLTRENKYFIFSCQAKEVGSDWLDSLVVLDTSVSMLGTPAGSPFGLLAEEPVSFTIHSEVGLVAMPLS